MNLIHKTVNSEKFPAEISIIIFRIFLEQDEEQDEGDSIYQETISKLLLLNKYWRNFIILEIKRGKFWGDRADNMLLKVLYDAVICQKKDESQQILDSGFAQWSREQIASINVSLMPKLRCSNVEHDQEIVDAFLKKLTSNYRLFLHSGSSKKKYEELEPSAFEATSPDISILVANTLDSEDHKVSIVVDIEQLQFLPVKDVNSNRIITRLSIEINELKWEIPSVYDVDEEYEEAYKFHHEAFSHVPRFAPDIEHLTLARIHNVPQEDFFVDYILDPCYQEVIQGSVIQTLRIIAYGENNAWFSSETDLEFYTELYSGWILESVNRPGLLQHLILEYNPLDEESKMEDPFVSYTLLSRIDLLITAYGSTDVEEDDSDDENE